MSPARRMETAELEMLNSIRGAGLGLDAQASALVQIRLSGRFPSEIAALYKQAAADLTGDASQAPLPIPGSERVDAPTADPVSGPAGTSEEVGEQLVPPGPPVGRRGGRSANNNAPLSPEG